MLEDGFLMRIVDLYFIFRKDGLKMRTSLHRLLRLGDAVCFLQVLALGLLRFLQSEEAFDRIFSFCG